MKHGGYSLFWVRKRFVIPAAVLAIALAGAAGITGASASAGRSGAEAPVGIVSADPEEQAAILAKMHVRRSVDIAGYRYYVGTMGGRPVVDTASGEMDETAELATWILDTTFHPRATVFSGTAGAQNAGINVGDVVLSGYVIDKSQIHYELGGYQSAYSGIEVHATGKSDVAGAIIDSYGNEYPTPSDASTFGSEPDPADKHWIFVDALAATRALVAAAKRAPTGTTTLADATGESSRKGSFANKVVVGAVGQANVWTEPLSWIEAQNMLFQTDAEENEGSGFAFANAAAGVPWMLVRGISDTPWFPDAYDADLASSRAAAVVGYMVARLPAVVSKTPVTTGDLSSLANARQAGYLVASRAYFTVSPVTKVSYARGGATVTLTGSSLRRLTKEYAYGAAHP